MKKNSLYIVFFTILMVLLFLPIIQQKYHPFKITKLYGSTIKTEKPNITLEDYKSGKLQSQLEKYVSENFGFHESVIRLYNQHLWFYRKTYGIDVAIGKEKWLYSKNSVRDYYRQKTTDYAKNNDDLIAKFNKDIDRFKKVQSLLKERGTDLFIIIYPAKDIIYPQYIPENNQKMGDGIRAIDYLPNAFKENGINCLNLSEWFNNIKDTVDYPIFPKTGMHWSNIACAHAADTIIHYMENLTGKNMPNVKLGKKYASNPKYPDADLERTMNLMFPIKPNQNYYADVKVIPDSTAEKLDLVAIGDSFFWNMCYTLPMDDIFNSHHYWYYFNTVYYDSLYTNVKEFDLVEQLDKTDIVMISLSATQLYDFNRNFLSQALLKLSLADPDVINSILQQIKERMRNSEIWYADLMKKAEKKGKTIDEVMDEDALYVLNQDPEQYIE